MKLFNQELADNKPPLFVAEISGNHDGTLENIIKHILAAQSAGADAVKIQTFFADEMTANNGYIIPDGLWKGKNLYDLYNSKSITGIVGDIFTYANSVGICLFSSVFGFKGLELLEKLNCPVYKISSFENNWMELIKACVATKKPVIVSMGGLTYKQKKEIENLAPWDIIPMHCVSAYPAKLSECRLHEIQDLWPMGFSDHTIGTKAAEYATIFGARIIEKHFALDYTSLDGYFSASPETFRRLVTNCTDAFNAMGYGQDNTQGSEFKRSWFYTRDMKAGEIITKDDVAVLRPNLGFSPDTNVIGRNLNVDKKAGDPV